MTDNERTECLLLASPQQLQGLLGWVMGWPGLARDLFWVSLSPALASAPDRRFLLRVTLDQWRDLLRHLYSTAPQVTPELLDIQWDTMRICVIPGAWGPLGPSTTVVQWTKHGLVYVPSRDE